MRSYLLLDGQRSHWIIFQWLGLFYHYAIIAKVVPEVQKCIRPVVRLRSRTIRHDTLTIGYQGHRSPCQVITINIFRIEINAFHSFLFPIHVSVLLGTDRNIIAFPVGPELTSILPNEVTDRPAYGNIEWLVATIGHLIAEHGHRQTACINITGNKWVETFDTNLDREGGIRQIYLPKRISSIERSLFEPR